MAEYAAITDRSHVFLTISKQRSHLCCADLIVDLLSDEGRSLYVVVYRWRGMCAGRRGTRAGGFWNARRFHRNNQSIALSLSCEEGSHNKDRNYETAKALRRVANLDIEI